MKKFYILFFVGFIVISALLYISIWLFFGGVTVILLSTIYHFYNTRMKSMDASIEDLESQVEELQVQLDRSLLKEEKATKEAGQIRQIKQELLTIISHEIRTPMNGVLGMSLLLADTPLDQEQKEYLDTIRHSGESLLATVNDILVNDILEFSKLDRKDKKLEVIDFDLRDTLEEVLNLFAAKAGNARLDLLYDIDDDVPVQLMGDSKRLREVLMNLVENAVKFTERGEILVSIHAIKNNSTQPELRFEVRDSGVGISEEQMEQLFYGIPGKEFQQEDEQSGLGLVICRKQVELMGGHIEARSKPGEGSTFTFNIPMSHSLKPARNSTPKDSIAVLDGKHILIVDDNTTSRNILIKQLKAWSTLPVGANSGMQALETLSQNSNFDLILIDKDMQQIDGLQLAKSIKNKYPVIPVVLLNPAGDEAYKQEPGLFVSVIAKPVRQHALQDDILAVFTKPVTAEQKTKPEKLEENFSQRYPLRILIAEDNLINQKIAMKILTKLGYQPKIANNGREALEMAGQEQYDIILMDVQMPEMDGLEATRMIRSNLSVQPVIMAMTANVMQGDRDLCLQAGMDDYISKPINLDELLSHLEKWSLIIKERQKA
jgi:signal transduction histidine kinase/CheY-like chemotaxis protein